MKSNRNVKFYCIYTIISAAILTRGIFLIYLQQKGMSVVEVSMYSMLFNVCIAISEIPTGYIGDRIGRRNSLIVGVILLSIQCLLMIIVRNRILLILTGGLEAVAYTFISGSDSALLYNLLDEQGVKEKYLRINSNLLAAQSVVTGGAIFVGGQLAEHSWTWPYYGTIGILILSLSFLFAVKEKSVHTKRDNTREKEIGVVTKNILYRPVSIFLNFFIGVSLIDGIACSYYNLNQIILKTVGYKVSMIGLFFSLSYFCNAFAYLLINVLTVFLKRIYIIVSSLVIQCIGFFLLSKTENIQLFFVISLILCFVPEIVFTVADSIIQEYIAEKNRATILSIMSLIRSMCSGAIYGIFGVALEIISLEQFLFLLSIVYGVSMFVALVFLHKYYKGKSI